MLIGYVRVSKADERSWYGLVGSKTINAVSVLASQTRSVRRSRRSRRDQCELGGSRGTRRRLRRGTGRLVSRLDPTQTCRTATTPTRKPSSTPSTSTTRCGQAVRHHGHRGGQAVAAPAIRRRTEALRGAASGGAGSVPVSRLTVLPLNSPRYLTRAGLNQGLQATEVFRTDVVAKLSPRMRVRMRENDNRPAVPGDWHAKVDGSTGIPSPGLRTFPRMATKQHDDACTDCDITRPSHRSVQNSNASSTPVSSFDLQCTTSVNAKSLPGMGSRLMISLARSLTAVQ